MLSLPGLKKLKMKKILFSGILFALVLSLAGCAGNRKLGCPATAKNTIHIRNTTT